MYNGQLTDKVARLSQLVDHINSLAPQLPAGLNNDAHKMRYLRIAVMSQEWAQSSISSIATAKYSFIQFITALQESLQLCEESRCARAPDYTLYGQYLNHPSEVSDPHNRNRQHSR